MSEKFLSNFKPEPKFYLLFPLKFLTNIKTQFVQSCPPDLPTSQTATSTAFHITFDGKLIVSFAQTKKFKDSLIFFFSHPTSSSSGKPVGCTFKNISRI